MSSATFKGTVRNVLRMTRRRAEVLMGVIVVGVIVDSATTDASDVIKLTTWLRTVMDLSSALTATSLAIYELTALNPRLSKMIL